MGHPENITNATFKAAANVMHQTTGEDMKETLKLLSSQLEEK
jgi:hypothetical protein